MPWETIGRIALLVLFDAALIGALIAIPIGLSGNFILLGLGLLIALLTGFQAVTPLALGVAAALAVGAEVLESLLGSLMARRYGASKWGMIGAYAGGILGAILGTPVAPLLGTLVGSLLGAALGAVLLEWIHLRRLRGSLAPGWGAILGKVAATLIKMGVGLGIALYLHIRAAQQLL